MDFENLIINQSERERLCVVRDAVERMYGVRLKICNLAAASRLNKIIEIGKSSCKRSETVGSSKHRSQDGSRHPVSKTSTVASCSQSDIFSLLQLEADVVNENLEKAKNFARTHLSPGADYITCTHQLENFQEFNMVLENSAHIQSSTSALLTFNPECLEVTLQGPPNSVTSARSSMVMMLDRLREQTSSLMDNTESQKSHQFFDHLILENFIENENNNLSSKVSQNEDAVQKEKKSNSLHHEKVKPCLNQSGAGDEVKNQSQVNEHVQDEHDDLDSDSTLSPVTVIPASLMVEHKQEICTDRLLKTSPTVSDDDISNEDIMLTDPRYSKKVEQALRLGYSEKHVTKVLAKLGPDCLLNDMLSELIKLGALDADSLSGQILSPEADSGEDLGFRGGHRYSDILGSEDNSGFPNCSEDSIPDDPSASSNLRDIIIDGSNVAMSHGKKAFSCKGIQIAVNWFRERGHKNITAFVPQWRKEASRPDAPITDQEILTELEKERVVVFTPARRVKGRRVVCYDDRYILKLAVVTDGIVVSNDVYRDLVNEREDFRKVVEQRLLMYSFVSDRFMPPEDPLGRLGPTLDNFLRKIPLEPTPRPQDCPYGKKCTYGNKCRFYHPERGFAPEKSVTETLKEQAEMKLQERATRMSEMAEKGRRSKQKLSRTKSLVPWDPLPSPASRADPESELRSQSEKPKLSHSKSLVALPSKSSDYLNESRKKLEEAELVAAIGRMSTQETMHEQQGQGFPHPDKKNKPKSPSPRSSPVPHRDTVKQPVTAGDSQPRSSTAQKSMTTSSQPQIPIKKQEAPEGYLSGHLYVAKKLSDEGCESSFFSDHTSSPSCTRTTSPVTGSANKPADHKQLLLMDVKTNSKDRQGNASGLYSFPPPFQQVSMHHQQAKWGPQMGSSDMDNIPNLSIFECEFPHSSSKFGNSDLPGLRHASQTSMHLPDYLSQKVDPCSPDSGLYTSYESLCSPFNLPEDPLQQVKGYPGSMGEKFPEHLNLKRAFSSAGSIKTVENLHQKLGRRTSGLPSHPGVDHQALKAQQSAPLLDNPNFYNPAHPPQGMTRQNSSSDPQIHNMTGDTQDLISSMFGPRDSARNFQSPMSSVSMQIQAPSFSQKQLTNQHELANQRLHIQQSKQQQQQQQNNMQLSPQMSKPASVTWEDFLSVQPYVHRPLPTGGSQIQYNPLQNPIHYHNPIHQHNPTHQTHLPHSNPEPQNTILFNPATLHLSHPPPSYPHPPMMYTAQFAPPPPPAPSNTYLDARRQSFPLPTTYPPLHISANQPPGCMDQYPKNPATQPASMLDIPPEEAPILPSDPRYLIYYHLKEVFGEQLVRRVMNLNRGELNPERVCTLIIKYKQETGM